MALAQVTQAEWLIMEAMYETFSPLLRSRPQIAVQMAEEIDVIARRYAQQHVPNEKRPARYQSNSGENTSPKVG